MRLINADRLRADVLSWENCYNGFSDTYDKARIIDAIDEQPTIEAEPVRRGRWELIDDIEPTAYSCSICNKVSTCKLGYCPYCGAKMEKE